MSTIASLFDSQAEATEALDAMAESEFSDLDVRVYESDVPGDATEAQPAAVPAPTASGPGAAVRWGTRGPLDDLEGIELPDLFIEAVEESQGVLVLAEVQEDRAEALQAFFDGHGGRTTKIG